MRRAWSFSDAPSVLSAEAAAAGELALGGELGAGVADVGGADGAVTVAADLHGELAGQKAGGAGGLQRGHDPGLEVHGSGDPPPSIVYVPSGCRTSSLSSRRRPVMSATSSRSMSSAAAM